MHYLIKKTAIGIGTALTLSALFGSIAFAGDVQVRTGAADCIPTDVKGGIFYTGNHISGNPVSGTLVNIAQNPECSDDVYVHVFGSHQAPETDGWLDSQIHVMSQTITVPQDGIDMNYSVTLPESDYCWYQVDVTRTPEVRIPPLYNGVDMIEYAFVRNDKACNEITPTPTATPSAQPTETPTPTPGNNNGGNTNSNNDSTPAKTVESIQAALAATTMAPTGGFTANVMQLISAAGMIITALGAASYAKEKKASRSN